MVLNTVWIAVATGPMAATQATEINTASNAYSMRSCPSSSLTNSCAFKRSIFKYVEIM